VLIKRATGKLEYVQSSEDFKAGELVAHAQNCHWLVGYSDLGSVLLSKDSKGDPMDPHAMLATKVLGISYDEFLANKKLLKYANTRQASKPTNFGKPTGMGDPKIVIQQRIQGEDTIHHTGNSMVLDAENNLVPGYKGMRYCILMGGEGPCGKKKTMWWNDRPITPMCVECLERSKELSDYWKRLWRENKPYSNYVSNVVDNGQTITWDLLRMWPWLQEYYEPGYQLAPGEAMQHFSGRIRGGLSFTECANGYFQGLLAEITKMAYCRAVRECYDRTIRVPEFLFENSIASKYAGCYSPLYGSKIPGFFHDELFGMHPFSVAGDAACRISEIMRDYMRMVCPDYADAAVVEPTLQGPWNKSASPVWHKGKLVVWTPQHNVKTCEECKV
jgi:hypothetical protein